METKPGNEAGADSSSATARRDRILLALAFTAGCVDALSYLGLSRVFTANMTGNAVLLGLAIGQTQELQVAHSSAAIVGFVLGVIVAAKLVGTPRERVVWSRGRVASHWPCAWSSPCWSFLPWPGFSAAPAWPGASSSA